jgi:hypothetical protein
MYLYAFADVLTQMQCEMCVAVAAVVAVDGEPRLGRWYLRADLWSSPASAVPFFVPQLSAQSAAATKPVCREV